MQIQHIDKYDRHGCNIRPHGRKLGMIEYWGEITNHEFNSAGRSGGLYEKLDEARAIASSLPGYEEKLAIPDLVFIYDEALEAK